MQQPPSKAPRRGTAANPVGRFEALQREAFDDGWGPPEPSDMRRTEVRDERVGEILSFNASPDLPFDRAINPYRGCEHGCIYCFARPSHGYLGMSAGLDFETRIIAKPDAPERLAHTLGKKSYVPRTIALGASTDPYQPAERHRGITRRILEVLERFRHPVSVVTKSNLVLRDVDILSRMAALNLALVALSVTTTEPAVARVMEPRAASPNRRLAALAGLQTAGIPTMVMVAPVIPALTDASLEDILTACHAAGTRYAAYLMLRLPYEVKDLYAEWLREHFPDRAEHVLSIMRQCRDGMLYRSDFNTRMRGTGPVADLIAQRFTLRCRLLGLQNNVPPLATEHFAQPGQMSLFGAPARQDNAGIAFNSEEGLG